VVETEGANYWYAIPPLTWFVSPVMGSVSIEFVPSAQALAVEAAEERVRTDKAAARRDADHGHVIPDARR
ncbi:MAG: hypothetical protein JNK15_24920, partial [Planctomycetes bacterium]|nr:hypothetical protein [Planctomycetota bacterium]